jgi:thiol-disulfide isomerase/thioredoxin
MKVPASRRWVRWAWELALAVAIVGAVGAWQTRGHLRDAPFPAFELEQLSGGRLSSTDLKGKPAMIALWAPWCGVCKAQADNISRVASWSGSSARVISIALEYERREDVERFQRENPESVPVLFGDGAMTRALHVTAFPTVYFVDAEGRVTRSVTGYTTTLGLYLRLLLS